MLYTEGQPTDKLERFEKGCKRLERRILSDWAVPTFVTGIIAGTAVSFNENDPKYLAYGLGAGLLLPTVALSALGAGKVAHYIRTRRGN